MTRQATPASTIGILSNANVRLDERLDLIDFLDDEGEAAIQPTAHDLSQGVESAADPTAGAAAAAAATGPRIQQRLICSNSRPTSGGTSLSASTVGWGVSRSSRLLKRHSSKELLAEYSESPASEVARKAELLAARNILHDEIPPTAPWWLQMLFCFTFPCFGVEASLKAFAPLLEATPRLRLEETLALIDRHACGQTL